MHWNAIRAAAAACPPTVALVFAVLLAGVTVAAPVARGASLVGIYDGGQMEMAAGLELKPDGRFRYALSYGALDEEAAGRWTLSGERVLLTSDPVNPPRFVLVSRGPAPDGMLQVNLDVPKGLSRQHFSAIIATANGAMERKQLTDEGLIAPFSRDNPPTGMRMLFPVFSLVSEPVGLDPGTGYSLRFRFDPNDVGKANFQATPLRIVAGELLLDRHGRTIRFRHRGR